MSETKYIKEQKLRELPASELAGRARELKALQFQQRFDRATGKLENYRQIPQTRRRLAAVLTLLRQQEQSGRGSK